MSSKFCSPTYHWFNPYIMQGHCLALYRVIKWLRLAVAGRLQDLEAAYLHVLGSASNRGIHHNLGTGKCPKITLLAVNAALP